jgi:hypothetical protein
MQCGTASQETRCDFLAILAGSTAFARQANLLRQARMTKKGDRFSSEICAKISAGVRRHLREHPPKVSERTRLERELAERNVEAVRQLLGKHGCEPD